MTRAYRQKLVISGDIIEYYEYEKPIFYEYLTEDNQGRNGQATEEQKRENRQQTMARAKRDLMRLINTNIKKGYSKFVTLTHAENETDIKKSNYEFKKFIQRLEYAIGFKVQYTCVLEFQKRGAIHYHLLMYNVPYIPKKQLEDIWSHGFAKINRINKVDNVGAYVTKYMTKENEDDRLKGEKSYFNSRGLKKPEIIKDDKEKIQSIASALDKSNKKVFENHYENEYNKTLYKQYNLNR